ncbi:MAG: hypothetical protein H6825_00805 [Planctomycetes bacterium]|nr:hypothetical protein [Planctomycetota bacterium]
MRARLLLIAVLAGLLFTAVRPVWTLDPDAAAYVSLARGLASGDGYVLDGVPHAKYPPGLPLLFAGVMAVLGPDAYGALHAVLVALLLVAVWSSALLVRRLGYPPAVALAVAACVGLCQPFFELSVEYLRSEVAFTALSLGALLACLAALSRSGRLAQSVLAGVLIAAAVLTRLAGVTLLVVPACVLLRPGAGGGRARGRAALVLVLGLLALGFWVERGRSLRAADPTLPDYGSEFSAAEPRDLTKTVRLDMPALDASTLLRRVTGNLDVLARASAVLLTNVDKAGARRPVGWLALALVLAGLGAQILVRGSRGERDARSRDVRAGRPPSATDDAGRTHSGSRRVLALYVLATMALYLVWPFDQQERFYVPLLPLLLLAAGEGLLILRGVLRRVMDAPSAWPRTLLFGAGLALVALLAMQRSDDPTVLGRWSRAYAALLGVALLGLLALAVVVRRRFLPLPRAGFAWLAAALFAVPFGALRFSEWPRQVDAFVARHATTPVDTDLGPIDVHPALERVAVYLREHAPRDSVLMTDVPKMMAVLSGLRCVPFVYRVDPPAVETGDATFVFYTRFWPDASAVLDTVAPAWTVELEVPLDDDPSGTSAVLYRVR